MGSKLEMVIGKQSQRVDPIENITAKVKETAAELLEFAMTRSNPWALGLAANQVKYIVDLSPLTLRLCVVQENGRIMASALNTWTVAYNPKIIGRSGLLINSREACLSWPGRTIIAERHEKVTVEYICNDGVSRQRQCSGQTAVIWQHEIDHLDGVPEHLLPMTTRVGDPLPGRNTICPCGSERKYKHCCGR